MDYVLRKIAVGDKTETVASATRPWHEALQWESDGLGRTSSQTVNANDEKMDSKREIFATTTEFESQSDAFVLEKTSLECVQEGRGSRRIETDTLALHVSSRQFNESCSIFIITRTDRKGAPISDVKMATSCTGPSDEEMLVESVELLESLKTP